MSVPKAVGIETEYGIIAHSAQIDSQDSSGSYPGIDPIAASAILLGQLPSLKLVTVPHRDCGYDPPPDKTPAGKSTGPTIFKVNRSAGYAGGDYDWMLANGSRLYIDHAHPEYCTPECNSLRTLIAADKAGEIILDRCCRAVVASGVLSPGQQISLYKNNSDHKGNSYGCHENYLLKSSLYEDMVYRQPELVNAHLLPFLVTRIIYCGAGKVGSENDSSPAGFQLSQRADFFETLVGLQTTHNRPLFNVRDEAHALEAKYRRLHVIVGDANMAELSTYLKVGPTLILFRMLEDGFLTSDLSLVDPLADFRTVSRDLSFTQKLALKNGEKLTALEIQRRYLGLAREYFKKKKPRQEDREILEQWSAVLDQLETNWRTLASSLDWAIKRRLLEHYLSSKGATWDSVARWETIIESILRSEVEFTSRYGQQWKPGATDPAWETVVSQLLARLDIPIAEYTANLEIYFRLRRLDLEYHDISRGPTVQQMGLFYRLQKDNLIKRIVSDAEIAQLITTPPPGTRAWFRGKSIEKFSPAVAWSDWSRMAFTTGANAAGDDSILVMDNPLSDYQKDSRRVWTRLAKTYRSRKRSKPDSTKVEV